MKTSLVKWTSRLAALAISLGVAGAMSGCLEPPKDINRVQPGYNSKSDFEGEWYSRAMIVDKQFHTTYPFVGYEGALDRIRWEITAGFLIAHRSYERVPGTEGADAGEQTVIAKFPIVSHFDIRRDYNPVNGVESNVIGENTTDRPWQERDYIRVNWGVNLSPDWDLNGYLMSFARPLTVDNANSDPTDPFKIRIEDSDGDERVDYMETTIDAVADPDPEACYYIVNDINCTGANIKLKLSFRKVDPDNDYEVLNYPDYEPMKYGIRADPISGQQELCFEGDSGCELQELWLAYGPFGAELCDPSRHDPDDCYLFTIPIFSKFGYFRTDRYVFDRENGYTLEGRERLINRWNIWERSKDAEGNPIPYADREVKPIVYYTNVQYPESLVPALMEMADDWDRALRDTVAALQGKAISDVPRAFEARLNDCNVENVNAYVNDNASVHDFRADLSRSGISEVTRGNLEQACAVLEHYGKAIYEEAVAIDGSFKPFHWQQVGDLRYSMLNWAAKSEIAGPLGYGPSAADPLTGEIISANANIYGASLDTYANFGADIVQLLNGELTTDDVINGTHVREHIENVRARYAESMSQERIGKFIQLFDERTAGMSDERYLKEVPPAAVNAMMDRIAETGFEEEYLLDVDTMLLFGGDPRTVAELGAGVDAETKKRALPSSWARQSIPEGFLTPTASDLPMLPGMADRHSAMERFRKKVDFLGRQNFCYTAEMVEPAVADLAVDLQGKTREEAVQFIRSAIFRAVMAHEVGHTLGLRHNFEGSSDALNFFPQYWGVTTGDEVIDSHNDREAELAYSSIMDYHQRFNSDFGGIGLYDKAAIKFGYGGLVEVFDEGRYDQTLQNYEDPFVPRDWDTNLDLFYPSDLPYLLAGGNTNEQLNDLYDEVYDALIHGDPDVFMDVKDLPITPNPANLFKRKDVSWDDFKRQEVLRIFGLENDDGSPTFTEVPYSFCSDAYAWGGNLTCNRYDLGATSEEIVRNAGEMYEFYYPFTAFRGQKVWDNDPVSGYMGRLYERTYQPMLNAFRYFYYYRRSTASIWPLIRDWSAASYVGLNFFGRVLQTPEPGEYCMKGDSYAPVAQAGLEGGCETGETFTLGVGDARYYDTSWSNEIIFRPNNIGHLWDKLLALQAMTSSNAFFFRDFSNLLSRGAFSIGYYRVFQPEIVRLFGSLMAQDREAYSPRVYINGKPNIIYTPVVALPGEEFEEIGAKLRPTDSYMTRYYALLFGMVNLTSNIDQTLDFATRARVSLLGSANDPVVDDSLGVDEIRWRDPLSNYVYRATAADGAELSVGYGLLDDAEALTADGTGAKAEGAWHIAKRELDAAKAALEDAQANSEPTGALETTVAEKQVAYAQQSRLLNDKVQLIDAVRQLSDYLEYSP